MIKDIEGRPIARAELDIGQTALNGVYPSQDEDQDTISFHGSMTAGDEGRCAVTAEKPAE